MCAIMGFSTKKLDKHEIWEYFDRTLSRGPDMSKIMDTGSGWLCFHRLAIMGLTEAGMQPFELDGDMVVCNGELYGFRPLKRQLTEKGYEFKSGSDCEIILPLYREYGLSMFAKLDAEFAMIIYDHKTDSLIAARDPIGIRPLFYGYLDDGGIVFASEAKNLIGLCKEVCPFPPGHYYADGKFVRYADLTTVTEYCHDNLETVCRTIRNKLIAGVDKRLDADAPLGFLLSGGLDSSLVCAISALVLGKKIRTFAIGMDKDAIDLKYAREVADYIGADHTEVYMTRQQVLDTLEEVISLLGTYDITTIRASMGMYLCCKAIHEQTDIRVFLLLQYLFHQSLRILSRNQHIRRHAEGQPHKFLAAQNLLQRHTGTPPVDHHLIRLLLRLSPLCRFLTTSASISAPVGSVLPAFRK